MEDIQAQKRWIQWQQARARSMHAYLNRTRKRTGAVLLVCLCLDALCMVYWLSRGSFLYGVFGMAFLILLAALSGFWWVVRLSLQGVQDYISQMEQAQSSNP